MLGRLVLVRIVACLGLRLARRRGSSGSGLLSLKAKMFFLKGAGYLRSLSEEVKILPNLAVASGGVVASSTKGVVIERIVGIVKLITKAIVGIFELESVIDVSMPGKACEGVVSLGETRPCLVVATGVEAEEGHGRG